jgi:hypothetical protein
MTCPPSSEIIAQVRAEFGPRTLLAFSCGKDSIAAWLAIRDSFEEVVPYYCYMIPDLELVEESLAYYERFFGVAHIARMPHPALYKWLNRGIFQTPGRIEVIYAAKLPLFEFQDIARLVAERAGIEKPMVADGVRSADSPLRAIGFRKYGAIRRAQGRYCPVWDWSKDRLIAEFERSGVKLPVDYDLFGRSFDGIDLRFVVPLKERRPADYRRVLEWFPLVEAAVWKYERSFA